MELFLAKIADKWKLLLQKISILDILLGSKHASVADKSFLGYNFSQTLFLLKIKKLFWGIFKKWNIFLCQHFVSIFLFLFRRCHLINICNWLLLPSHFALTMQKSDSRLYQALGGVTAPIFLLINRLIKADRKNSTSINFAELTAAVMRCFNNFVHQKLDKGAVLLLCLLTPS